MTHKTKLNRYETSYNMETFIKFHNCISHFNFTLIGSVHELFQQKSSEEKFPEALAIGSYKHCTSNGTTF